MTYIPRAAGELRATQPAAGAEGTTQSIILTLAKELIIAGFDWARQTLSTTESDPIDTRDVADKLALVNIDKDALSYYYFDMAHYRHITIQLYFYAALGVGISVEASAQDDGTAPASCTYVDVTNDWFGAPSYNADVILEKDTPTTVKWVRLVVDNTGGAETEDVDVFVRRAY